VSGRGAPLSLDEFRPFGPAPCHGAGLSSFHSGKDKACLDPAMANWAWAAAPGVSARPRGAPDPAGSPLALALLCVPPETAALDPATLPPDLGAQPSAGLCAERSGLHHSASLPCRPHPRRWRLLQCRLRPAVVSHHPPASARAASSTTAAGECP